MCVCVCVCVKKNSLSWFDYRFISGCETIIKCRQKKVCI